MAAAAGAAVCARLLDLPLYRAARGLALYIAHENEVSTDALIDEALASGRRLYLPCDMGEGAFVAWVPGTPLRRARGGVREPTAGEPAVLEPPAIVLLPVVAWDQTGTRLGRGGGFYDRLLVTLDRRVVRIGLAYEFQQYPELPRQAWDASMHYVITERRVVACDDGCAASFQKGGLQG